MSMDYVTQLLDAGLSAMSDQLFRVELDAQPFDFKELRHCIMMEQIRDAYYESEPRASLRSYVEEGSKDSDDIRMRNQRMLKYAQHYRNIQYENMVKSLGAGHPDLLPDDMEGIENKLVGHKITPMQFFELSTMADYPVLKAIISKRICEVKKISNSEFISYMEQYDQLTHSLLDRLEEERVFATIALYVLEWKYNVELFYSCAVEAEKHKCKEVRKEDMILLCCDCNDVLRLCDLHTMIHTHNRFIKKRLDLVPSLYDGTDLEYLRFKIFAYHNLKYEVKWSLTVNDVPFVTIFREQTTPADWAEYLRQHYDIKTIYKEKEWTPVRIRYVRKLYDTLYQNQPTPKL